MVKKSLKQTLNLDKKVLSSVSQVDIDRNIASRSFYEFCKMCWPIIEPGTKFLENWHLEELCHGLEMMLDEKTKVRDLIIALPPRVGKTRILTNFYNCWIWGPKGLPWKKIICASHNEQKAFEEAINTRKILESDFYQERWPLKLTDDQNTKGLFVNSEGGYRLSVGTKTGIQGMSGEVILVDDPISAQDKDSVIELDRVNTWYDKTLSTRRNNTESIRIVCQQRLSLNDLIGHIEDKKFKYEQIIFPMTYEGAPRFKSTIGVKDHRKKKGELLWPERFPQYYIGQMIADDLGEEGTASQFQMRPNPLGGNIYRRDFFRERINPEKIIARWISWDTASVKTGAFSAATVFDLLPDWKVFVREVYQNKLEIYDLQREIERIAYKYKDCLNGILIENESDGIQVMQMISQTSPDWLAGLIIPITPDGDKPARAKQSSIWCQNGCVLLPRITENDWMFDFESQLFNFPNGKYKDMIDSFSQGINFLAPYLSRGYHDRNDLE
jgi:predicted phage terminase large subunit-like protein